MYWNRSLSLSIDCVIADEVTITFSRHGLHSIIFFSLLLTFLASIISNDFSFRHINMYQTTRQIERICGFGKITRTTLGLKSDHFSLLNLSEWIIIFIIKIIRFSFASIRSSRPHRSCVGIAFRSIKFLANNWFIRGL